MASRPFLVGVFVFNEGEKFVRLMAEDTWDELDQCDVLVIDDGSEDNAAQAAASRNFPVLRNDVNQGIGFSIKRLLTYAHENGYSYVVIMAGNGKMPPAEIKRFLKAAAEGYDYIQGSRFVGGDRSTEIPAKRRLAIKIGTPVIRLLCRLRYPYTDLSCGFRCYRVAPLFDDPRFDIFQPWLDKYELEYYLHYKFDKLGYRVTEVPCTMRYKAGDRNYSKIKPFKGWWSMLRPWIFLLFGLRK